MEGLVHGVLGTQSTISPLLSVQIILGWVWRWAQGQGVEVFGIFAVASPFTFPPSVRHVFGLLHYWNAHAIVALAGLHALAALFHHFVLRDAVLHRMASAGTRP